MYPSIHGGRNDAPSQAWGLIPIAIFIIILWLVFDKFNDDLPYFAKAILVVMALAFLFIGGMILKGDDR
jgi:hypothetical protein